MRSFPNGSRPKGSQTSVSFGKLTNRKPPGNTPHTSKVRPSSVTVCPLKFGLALNSSSHDPWLMMTAREPLGLSSSSRKLRPSIGCTPSTEKRLAETTAYCTFSGSATPDRLNEPYNDQALISAQL